jgi:hypothetical protein
MIVVHLVYRNHFSFFIQLFTTFLMWQGGHSLYFIFKTQKVVGDYLAT